MQEPLQQNPLTFCAPITCTALRVARAHRVQVEGRIVQQESAKSAGKDTANLQK